MLARAVQASSSVTSAGSARGGGVVGWHRPADPKQVGQSPHPIASIPGSLRRVASDMLEVRAGSVRLVCCPAV